MLTLRATLTNGRIEFQPPFTPPAQAVEILVTFVEEVAEAVVAAGTVTPKGRVSDGFRWRESRARTTDLGGKSASQLCLEDREDDWR